MLARAPRGVAESAVDVRERARLGGQLALDVGRREDRLEAQPRALHVEPRGERCLERAQLVRQARRVGAHARDVAARGDGRDGGEAVFEQRRDGLGRGQQPRVLGAAAAAAASTGAARVRPELQLNAAPAVGDARERRLERGLLARLVRDRDEAVRVLNDLCFVLRRSSVWGE